MRTILALCLIALASLASAACTNEAIPNSVAEALATKGGGTALTHDSSHQYGLTTHAILVCDKDEKVQMVTVFGKATEPQTTTQSRDLGLYCGSRAEFWKLYDEKARTNLALREEMAKLVDVFGLKNRD